MNTIYIFFLNYRFVEEPWRIVLPALVFFMVMTIISSVHLILIVTRLNGFCDSLKFDFHDKSIPCGLLLDRFSLKDIAIIPASSNYLLSIIFAWLTLLLWASAVIIMMLRFVYGTDFEMIDLPVSLLNHYADKEHANIEHHTDEDADDDYNLQMDEVKLTPTTNEYRVIVKEPVQKFTTPKIQIENTPMTFWPAQQKRKKLINEVAKKETGLNK